ncbi:hypothetical protein NPIL_603021, partial [Nephila pilipes]
MVRNLVKIIDAEEDDSCLLCCYSSFAQSSIFMRISGVRNGVT